MMNASHKNGRDIIIFVNYAGSAVADAKKKYKKTIDKQVCFFLLTTTKKAKSLDDNHLSAFDAVLTCDFSKPSSIAEALRPYEHRLAAITTRSESNIPYLQVVIPHVPYLKTPTTHSLDWATHKLQMRRKLRAYDRAISPVYSVVKNTTKKEIQRVIKKVGFPLIVKPTGLATSMLVNVCYHQEELEATLKKVFRKMNKVYRDSGGRGDPAVLIEEFMEGKMYAVDAYVNSRGTLYFCPLTEVKTGKEIGFDDFFAYQTITPAALRKDKVERAQNVATKAVHALGLRSTTVHIELMKTEYGWKIIELGPRIGGFREDMYRLSYGIEHTINDILIRLPRRPIIPRQRKGYTAVMKFFASKEGEITQVSGVKKAQELSSFVHIKQSLRVGDRALYAKHGGKNVFNITLFNKTRSKLLADIRRLEKMVKINTKK